MPVFSLAINLLLLGATACVRSILHYMYYPGSDLAVAIPVCHMQTCVGCPQVSMLLQVHMRPIPGVTDELQ